MSEPLTRRHKQVLELAATTELSGKEIAAKLGVEPGTVKNHLHEIYARLSVKSRIALVLWYVRQAKKQ